MSSGGWLHNRPGESAARAGAGRGRGGGGAGAGAEMGRSEQNERGESR